MSLNVYELHNPHEFFLVSESFANLAVATATASVWKSLLRSLDEEVTETTARYRKAVRDAFEIRYTSLMQRIVMECDPYTFTIFASSTESGSVIIYAKTTAKDFTVLWNSMALRPVPTHRVPTNEEVITFSSTLCTGQRVLRKLKGFIDAEESRVNQK